MLHQQAEALTSISIDIEMRNGRCSTASVEEEVLDLIAIRILRLDCHDRCISLRIFGDVFGVLAGRDKYGRFIVYVFRLYVYLKQSLV